MKVAIEELLEKKAYKKIKDLLSDISVQDIAEMLEDAEPLDVVKLFRLLSKDLAAEVFVYLPLDLQQEMITLMSGPEAGALVELLASDDAVDLFDEMPANVVTRILGNTTKETRKEINDLLKYPEDSAGSIMTTEYIDLKINMTVEACLKKIRLEAEDKESINNCFVLDNTRRLLGTVDIKDLILANPEERINAILKEDSIFADTLEDQESVAADFKKYDLLLMPVVDSEKRMVGIITIDDIIDILEEETSEDMDIMAAITPLDKPYLSRGVWEIYKSRIPWLLVLMLSATFTSIIISKFEAALASMVILTSYIPMFMGTAGNASSQSSVTIIRALAIGDIAFKDFFKVVFKESIISILCGITLAICNFAKLLIFDGVSVSVALVVCLTLLVTIIIAKIIGAALPICAKKIGFDPAVMASPFITTIVDAVSLIVYFNIAGLILGL